MMTGSTISFDELFAQQDAATGGLRFTVQQIPDDSAQVKITPVDEAGNCWCSSALVIAKTCVGSLTTTGDVGVCCGKTLPVVEIEFADTALATVVEQVHARAASSARQPDSMSSHTFVQALNQLGIQRGGISRVPGGLRFASPIERSMTLEEGAASPWSCAVDYLLCMLLCGGYEGCAHMCAERWGNCH